LDNELINKNKERHWRFQAKIVKCDVAFTVLLWAADAQACPELAEGSAPLTQRQESSLRDSILIELWQSLLKQIGHDLSFPSSRESILFGLL